MSGRGSRRRLKLRSTTGITKQIRMLVEREIVAILCDVQRYCDQQPRNRIPTLKQDLINNMKTVRDNFLPNLRELANKSV